MARAPKPRRLEAALADPMGSFLPALWYHGLRDRLRGRAARARARWGRVRAPAARGRVVWLVAGATRESVGLGVALVQAIRLRRLDIRLVLTFETEFPDLLAGLAESPKTGWGYGACDHPLAVSRMLARLSPLGVIFVRRCPRPHLARAVGQVPHVLVIDAEGPEGPLRAERIYPSNASQGASWRGATQAPAADLATLLIPAQVEPNFKSLINGASSRHLWWLHGDDGGRMGALLQAVRSHFPDDVFFLSGRASEAFAHSLLPLSRWERAAVPGGALVAVDVLQWLPALAASATGAHFERPEPSFLWVALAGGCAVSCADIDRLPKPALSEAVSWLAGPDELIGTWSRYRADPIFARGRGDAARRVFWEERRLAGEINEELLERIFAWS
ncbi:MAG: hypothetical protein M0T84_09425 [Betaproteobacteria bacterium]|nr:hypothetical protein [Betaproteobacteria bacterium]